MFAVLYYLLIINWSWATNMNYDIIEEGLNNNTERTKARSDELFNTLQQEAKRPGQRDRITPFLQKVERVRSRTDSLFAYLEQLKELNRNGKGTEHVVSIAALLGKPVVDSLRHSLDNGLKYIIERCSDRSFRRAFGISAKQHWKDPLLFYKTRPEGVNCIISLLQDDIYHNEFTLTQQVFSKAGSYGGCCLCGPMAIAIPTTPYIVPGQKVKAIMLLADYHRYPEPIYTSSTGKIVRVERSIATWNGYGTHLGLNTVTGVARMVLDPELDTLIKPFSFQYFVAAPGITMNINKANICYVGVNNPITISVPGYDTDKLSLKVKDAEVTETSPGKFNIYFKKVPKEKTYAFVEGTNAQGSTSIVGSLPLAVKDLPTPKATIYGAINEYIVLRHFKNATGLSIIPTHEDFEMTYTIVSYKLSLLHHKNSLYIEPVKGKGNFHNNPAIMKILDIARRGDKAIFEDIIAKDANGRLIELAPILLKLH